MCLRSCVASISEAALAEAEGQVDKRSKRRAKKDQHGQDPQCSRGRGRGRSTGRGGKGKGRAGSRAVKGKSKGNGEAVRGRGRGKIAMPAMPQEPGQAKEQAEGTRHGPEDSETRDRFISRPALFALPDQSPAEPANQCADCLAAASQQPLG